MHFDVIKGDKTGGVDDDATVGVGEGVSLGGRGVLAAALAGIVTSTKEGEGLGARGWVTLVRINGAIVIVFIVTVQFILTIRFVILFIIGRLGTTEWDGGAFG